MVRADCRLLRRVWDAHSKEAICGRTRWSTPAFLRKRLRQAQWPGRTTQQEADGQITLSAQLSHKKATRGIGDSSRRDRRVAVWESKRSGSGEQWQPAWHTDSVGQCRRCG